MRRSDLFIITLFVLLLIWFVLSFIVNKEILIPTPQQVCDYLLNISPLFVLKNIFFTLSRAIFSYLIALIFAFVLSLLSLNKHLKEIISTINSFLRTIPTISVIILALIWLGRNNAPYLIGFLVIFPILYDAVVNGLYGVDNKLLELANVYKFTRKTKIIKIYLPSIMENLLLSFKQTLGLNLKVMVMSEVLSQSRFGVGSRILIEKINLNTSGVFAWTIILIIIVLVIDKIIDYSNDKLLIWK